MDIEEKIMIFNINNHSLLDICGLYFSFLSIWELTGFVITECL